METESLKKITWQELEEHNKAHDAWIGIKGKVYDVTKWMNSHPGGSDTILLFAGRESTEVFDSYHKLSTDGYLGTQKVPCVGELVTTKYPLYVGKTEFYPKLRRKVEDLMKKKGITDVRKVNTHVIQNTAFIIGGMLFSYFISMYSNASFLVKFIFAITAGIFHHLSMVHLLHDASHFCYSRISWVWNWVGYFGDALTGHSMYVWIHRHVVGHHYYTNVSGVDPDIGIYKCSPHKPIMNYRTKIAIAPTWFQPFLYFFVVAQMQIDDMFSYARGAMENCIINDTGFFKTFQFYFGKLLFISQRVILPIYFGNGIFTTLYLFIVTEAVAGLLFGYFSQITHVSDEVVWPKDTPIPRDWAELQVETAVDFCQDSWFWTYLSGYLNYQVVHHLFPSIAPYHYPDMLPLILESCKESNLKYIRYDSFLTTVAHHFDHLKPFQEYRKRYYDKVQKEKKDVHLLDKMDGLVQGIFSNKKID